MPTSFGYIVCDMSKSPLDKKLKDKSTPKRHTTALRVPNQTWDDLQKLSSLTKLTINAIVNTAINELISKETSRLKKAA